MPNLVMERLPATTLPCDVCVKSGKQRLAVVKLAISSNKVWHLCQRHADTVQRTLIITGLTPPDTIP